MPTNKPEFYSKTPAEIQELLNNCVSKTLLARQLNTCLKTLNNYIKKYNLQYESKVGKTRKPQLSKGVKGARSSFREPNVDFIPSDLQTPSSREALENFYKILAAKKEKRLLQELKDAYY
jgi:hypothetical protein